MSKLGIFLSVVGLFIWGGITGYFLCRDVVSRDMRELAHYRSTYLYKIGASQGFGSYNLRSFDGGKQWYAVETNSDGSVIIKGLAEDVHPGLLAHLEGWDKLLNYVKENGPLNFSAGRIDADISALKGTGITVEKR